MNSLIQRVATFALTLIFATIPFISTSAHAYSYTSWSSPTGAWGWTGSYEILKFTRDTITLVDENGAVILDENVQPFII